MERYFCSKINADAWKQVVPPQRMEQWAHQVDAAA